MIPLWKLRREWKRLGLQLRTLPEAIWEPRAQARHDAAFAAGFPQTEGALARGGKLALLLLYQPAGLADSTVATCAHLAARGFSPLIVSNAPLSPADRARLAPQVWRMIERPNFGYDFGGYRDGIRHILNDGPLPDRLLVLNDSIWFPLWPDETLLDRLEASGADMAGTILRERGEELFLESYCYLIRRSALESPAFRAFWDGLRITSNKYKVVRRGERGHSRALRAAGLRVEGVYTQADFLRLLEGEDDDFLHLTLTHAEHLEPAFQDSRRAVLASPRDAGWRGRALAHVRLVLGKGQIYANFPVAAVRLMGYPLLKKSADPVSTGWRRAWLGAVEAGALPPPPEPFLSEIRARTPGAAAAGRAVA